MQVTGEPKPGKGKLGKLRPIHVALILSIIAWGGTRAYASYLAVSRYEALRPNLTLTTWLGDLRAFHTRERTFPADLKSLDTVIWLPRRQHGEPPLAFGNADRSLEKGFYYYFYTIVPGNQNVCTTWAVPTGPRRAEASTTFVVITPDMYRLWRGPALSDAEIQFVPRLGLPTPAQLATLGMTEQPVQKETRPRTGMNPFSR